MHFSLELRRSGRFIHWISLAGAALLFASFAQSQQPPQIAQPAGPAEEAEQQQPKMMQLTLPDNVTLNVLADLTSVRLGIKIIYDDEIRQQKISIKAPAEIPEESLLPLLESVLKIKGFALIDADVQGWKRIVKTQKLTEIARPNTAAPVGELLPTEAITQAFTLKHTSPARIDELIKPFLTEPGANTILLNEQNTLIVTDYAGNLERITKLINSIDMAGPRSVLEFYKAEHVEVGALQQQIAQVLASRVTAQAATTPGAALQITPDARTNQLLITGTPGQVEDALGLARALDVPLGLDSKVYAFQFVEAARVDRLVRDLLDPLTADRLYRSSVDDVDNLLIVSAPREIHQRIEGLKSQMDVESKRPGSAVKFYKLKFANAAEVLQTIHAVQQGTTSLDRFGPRGVSPIGRGRYNDLQYTNPVGYGGQFVPGPNQPAVPGALLPPTTPAYVPSPGEIGTTPPAVPIPLENGGAAPTDATAGLLPSSARVTADPNTNSIIVVADRATQQVYADLIEFLDRRRPQVMIEAKVVILDTTDNYSLGIEISGGDRLGINKLFQFTSYGLSMVDPVTGSLALIPGRGYNWTLVEPDVADAVLRALSGHTKARVMSSPRVLVNDNATGTLASVAEVPFTSVNASQTVATTSFAGFAEAGTTIEVTPRISDDDHLELDFVVTLNSFTGAASAGVPPPRQTNEVTSTVNIPDGYTVIVGGLNQKNNSHTREGIPYIEKIPVLREITGNYSSNNSQNTLFVFLRAVILRDDDFEDLKYLSDRDLGPTHLRGNYPVSQPVLITGGK